MNRFYKYLRVILIIIMLSSPVKAGTGLVYKIPISGEIDPGLVKIVARSINEAEESGADLVIFEIDTYGGYVDSAIKIRDMLLESTIPSYTFVKGRAWSAGALITLAGNKVAMKPGSSIGAAETRPNEEKYISALRKEFKSTAEVRGKNPQVAAAMVDADIEIEGLTVSGKLLTLTASEALNHGIADIVVNDVADIFAHEDLIPARIIDIEFTAAEKAARFINKPEVSATLITLGLIALLIEAFMAGFGVAGVLGLLSLGIVFSSHIYYGGASWGLVILFLLGLVLILLEVFVIPGFGLAGIAGLVALLASIYLLFPTTEIALLAIALIMLFTILAIAVLIKLFGVSPLWKRISLNESQTTEAGYTASTTKKDLLGKKARTLTPLRPSGIAEINGCRIDVVSEVGFIEKGQEVEIVKVSGNRIVVKKS